MLQILLYLFQRCSHASAPAGVLVVAVVLGVGMHLAVFLEVLDGLQSAGRPHHASSEIRRAEPSYPIFSISAVYFPPCKQTGKASLQRRHTKTCSCGDKKPAPD